jgi:hypothetical protein
MLAPVKPGSQGDLLAALGNLASGASPFAEVAGTHFGRWVVVEALRGASGGFLDSEGPFLFMSAEFDQEPAEWTALLCARAGEALDAVMCHCEGFPGSGDADAVTAFFASHAAKAGFTVAGYREVTVEQVRAALRLRATLRELALQQRAEKLGAGELRRRWREATER